MNTESLRLKLLEDKVSYQESQIRDLNRTVENLRNLLTKQIDSNKQLNDSVNELLDTHHDEASFKVLLSSILFSVLASIIVVLQIVS